MASVLFLGVALVAAFISNVDAQVDASLSIARPGVCSSFPRDTCPVGYNCINGYCESSTSSFCRFDSDCPFNFQCRRGRCVPRDGSTNCNTNPFICRPFEVCNSFTGRCEQDGGQDCRPNPFICQPFETCNRRTGRCELNPFDCRRTGCPPGETCQYRFGRYECIRQVPECRPWVPNDCPFGYYCNSRRQCVRDFIRGAQASGSPAASTTGEGM